MGLIAKTDEQRRTVADKYHASVIDIDDDGMYIDGFIRFDEMADIVDYLRSSKNKNTELFDECWIAYRRKGVKAKARQYWNKLNEDEMRNVLPHIKAYVSSRDVCYQKDFERYLRDKVFMTVVYSGNNIIYDPTKSEGNDSKYTPACGGALNWNDYYGCYMYTGAWYGSIADGYTDDTRPDGASITLNNGRGVVIWSKESKEWRAGQ